MIDFTLSENDQKVLDYVRSEALVARKYARQYDENEHEFPPEELPEKDQYPGVASVMGGRTAEDTSMATMSMLMSMGQFWGDYSVRIRQGRGALGNAALGAAGTDEQKMKFGRMVLAMAITEPGCGSDPSQVQTTAVLDGDEWVINGEKIFVTTGCRADGVVVWATLDRSAGRAGIKSFVIERGTPGFVVAHKEKKLGIRADDTAAYVFTDCRIPRGNLLGGNEKVEPKKGSGGFKGVMKTFNMTRPGVAAMGLGMSRAALDFTGDQLREAGYDVDSYGGGLGSQSAVIERFQRLEAMQEAAELTVLRAAWLSDKGLPNNREASISKAKGGASVRLITQGCIDLLGPIGASREHLLEKWFRDVRITDIYEGTQQIQHLIIARDVLGYGRAELS
jgi:acyl-CoA dehydrogenase